MPKIVNVMGYLWYHIGHQPLSGLLSALLVHQYCPTALLDWCDLPLSEQLFLNGRVTVVFSGSIPTSRALALLLDFKITISSPLAFDLLIGYLTYLIQTKGFKNE